MLPGTWDKKNILIYDLVNTQEHLCVKSWQESSQSHIRFFADTNDNQGCFDIKHLRISRSDQNVPIEY